MHDGTETFSAKAKPPEPNYNREVVIFEGDAICGAVWVEEEHLAQFIALFAERPECCEKSA